MKVEKGVLDDASHEVQAAIVGEQLHKILVCDEIAAINNASIERGLPLVSAVDRWTTALQYCVSPQDAEEDMECLDNSDRKPLSEAMGRLMVVQTALERFEQNERLRVVFDGYPDLRGTTIRQMCNLLANGVIDSMNWIEVLRARRMSYGNILKHPIFPVATTLTMEVHGALIGVYSVIEDDLPNNRNEAVRILEKIGRETIARAAAIQGMGGAGDRELRERGFCPAAKMRDSKGKPWLTTQVEQAVHLHKSLVPKPTFRLP